MIPLPTIFSVIAVLASLALIWGGLLQTRRPEARQRGILMIVAAIVLLANAAILTL